MMSMYALVSSKGRDCQLLIGPNEVDPITRAPRKKELAEIA